MSSLITSRHQQINNQALAILLPSRVLKWRNGEIKLAGIVMTAVAVVKVINGKPARESCAARQKA